MQFLRSCDVCACCEKLHLQQSQTLPDPPKSSRGKVKSCDTSSGPSTAVSGGYMHVDRHCRSGAQAWASDTIPRSRHWQ
jgi:hypothetical protein